MKNRQTLFSLRASGYFGPLMPTVILFCVSMLAMNDALCTGKSGKSQTQPTVEEIIARNVSARGGLKVWKKVQTLSLSGILYTGKPESPQVPIVIQLKRPNKNRQEVMVHEQKFAQAFDGKNGWKIRSFHGQNMIAPYGPEDTVSSSAWQDFLAPLVEIELMKGKADFTGVETINGKPAYRLRLTRPGQSEQYLWVDAKSFLDVKTDTALNLANGLYFRITTYYDNYQHVDGVLIPGTITIQIQNAKAPRKLIFRQVVVNRPIDDRIFERPPNPSAHRGRALKQ